jgi:hypothetical protein
MRGTVFANVPMQVDVCAGRQCNTAARARIERKCMAESIQVVCTTSKTSPEVIHEWKIIDLSASNSQKNEMLIRKHCQLNFVDTIPWSVQDARCCACRILGMCGAGGQKVIGAVLNKVPASAGLAQSLDPTVTRKRRTNPVTRLINGHL